MLPKKDDPVVSSKAGSWEMMQIFTFLAVSVYLFSYDLKNSITAA